MAHKSPLVWPGSYFKLYTACHNSVMWQSEEKDLHSSLPLPLSLFQPGVFIRSEQEDFAAPEVISD